MGDGEQFISFFEERGISESFVFFKNLVVSVVYVMSSDDFGVVQQMEGFVRIFVVLFFEELMR